MEKNGYVYFLTNRNNTVIYVGVTSDLKKRTYEHRNKLVDGFSKRYNLNKLVYFEVFDLIFDAIVREKQIKAGSRKKKIDLIMINNPSFEDLYEKI